MEYLQSVEMEATKEGVPVGDGEILAPPNCLSPYEMSKDGCLGL